MVFAKFKVEYTPFVGNRKYKVNMENQGSMELKGLVWFSKIPQIY